MNFPSHLRWTRRRFLRPLRRTPFLLGLVGLLLTALLPGCGKPPQTALFVLFDLSGSTSSPVIRQRYYREFVEEVIGLPPSSPAPNGATPSTAPTATLKLTPVDNRFQDGVIVEGDIISANSLATGSIPLKGNVPPYNGFKDNPLKYQSQTAKAYSSLKSQAKELILQHAPESHSDLMNAFQLAAKMFQSDTCKSAPHKVLVVFSDMLEQTSQYDFSVENLTSRRIQAMIQQERDSGRLPDLNGVQVWVSGATAAEKGGVSPKQIYQVQDFWLAYFQACGADMTKAHYGPSLVNFQLPTSPQP